MISRNLDLDDYIWALDHSRRRYLVRQTRESDTIYFETAPIDQCITIIRLHGIANIIIIQRTGSSMQRYWSNTDYFAEHILKDIEAHRKGNE